MRLSTFLWLLAGACLSTEVFASNALDQAVNVMGGLGGGAMPWESPMRKIANSITGPVAQMAGVIIITITALTWSLGQGGDVIQKFAKVGTGLAVAFNAASWGLPLLGYGSGCLLL